MTAPPDDDGMSKPDIVVVGHLRAVAYRPPSKADDRWAWRCRSKGATLWTGRGTPAEVAVTLAGLLLKKDAPPTRARAVETVGQVLDVWYTNEVQGRREPATDSSYRARALSARRLIGDLRIDRSQRVIDELHRQMEALGWTRATRRLTQTVLIMAWQWAHMRAVIDTPAPARRRLPKEARDPRAVPTLEQVLQVIRCVREPWQSVLRVQLATGARIGEVCAIEPGDIEESGRLLLTLGVHRGARKTGARTIPITNLDALRILKRHRAEAMLAGRAKIWAGPLGGRVTVDSVTSRIAKAQADSAAPFTTHALRYLAVLMMRKAGVMPETAAAILGHSVAMMLSTYRLIGDGELAEAMERVRLGEG